ncbi:MAG: AAA family ATPase [Chitinophagales bacterium]|nr:AAA family ATPase [Chitinophagales bacterium]
MRCEEYDIATEFVLHTNRHVFLTGRAGSGKTTLLRHFTKHSDRKFLVAAPTGVAAVNAGGVTLHSQFNLPLTPFVPSNEWVDLNSVTNRRALLQRMRMSKEKRQVLRELEQLIIDEASMVRADLLDAVDFVMRTVRSDERPFGGVQVILIGDLYQLPPVVKDNEWEVLQHYYASPYFFDAQVWPKLDAVQIELKNIFRQNDERFLQLLHNIRHHHLSAEDYELLKTRYVPGFRTSEPGYILLTTHNYKAQAANEAALRKLNTPEYVFEAEISGDFPEHLYPCDKTLVLKPGAQVMFTRNDTSGNKYYNGKLADICSVEEEGLVVRFHDNNEEYLLKPVVWENINYHYNEQYDRIESKQIGTFTQYPLRLAWAVTIHKSQGLTFDKVVIDAAQSFAPGQVYVALSRCRTLEGIVLQSLITQRALHADERILQFDEELHTADDLRVMLEIAKAEYAHERLKKLFDFGPLRFKVNEWKDDLWGKDLPDKESALQLLDDTIRTLDEIIETGEKFAAQLTGLLHRYGRSVPVHPQLLERCEKAIAYFTEQIFTRLVEPVQAHINSLAYKTKVKGYVQRLQVMQRNFQIKIEQLYGATYLGERLYPREAVFAQQNLHVVKSSVTEAKRKKGATYEDTLLLHRQGKDAHEIAAIRGLAVSTVKGHIARWIQKGEIRLEEVLPPDVVQPLRQFYQTNEEKTVSAAMSKFGNLYDPSDIRMVLASLGYGEFR